MLRVNHPRLPEEQLISKGHRNGATKKHRSGNGQGFHALVCKAALARRCVAMAAAGRAETAPAERDARIVALAQACQGASTYGGLKQLCPQYLHAKAIFHKSTGVWAGNSTVAGNFSVRTPAGAARPDGAENPEGARRNQREA